MAPHNRRTVLKLVGIGVGAAATGVATGEDQGDEAPYSVVQDDRCIPVTPISGSEPVEAFYDWAATAEKRWSSNGTTHLQREDASVAFLYDGPEGTSLVIVHGMLEGDGTGGSVSFSIYGLPTDGEWVVRDDHYDGSDNHDVWTHEDTASEIDWTWDGGRTDGGVFRGVSADDTVRIVPRFNEEAALYGEHYQGDVERWEFLSGGSDDPRRIELDMMEPVLIAENDCDGDSSGGSGGDDRDDDDDHHDDKDDHDDDDHDDTDDDGDDDDDRRERSKHERKQAKHRRKQTKHERKQAKHERKHQAKQRKHERKHERKQRKHEEKARKERRKHERKREKHEKEDERGGGRGRGNGRGNGRGKGKGNRRK